LKEVNGNIMKYDINMIIGDSMSIHFANIEKEKYRSWLKVCARAINVIKRSISTATNNTFLLTFIFLPPLFYMIILSAYFLHTLGGHYG
jgi:hypothetical protein